MKKLISLLLVLVLLFSFAACGRNSDPEQIPTETPPAPTETTPPTEPEPSETTPPTEAPATVQVGYYLLKYMRSQDTGGFPVELEPGIGYLEFREDHTGYIWMNGVGTEVQWDNDSLSYEGEPLPYELDGEKVILPSGDADMVFVYGGTVLPEEYQIVPPEAGFYVVSSVGEDGNVSFYPTLVPANGWLRLEADGTGALYWKETEQNITYDSQNIYTEDITIPFVYYTEEDTQEEPMIMLYFLEESTSVALRLAEGEPEE